MPAQAGSKDRKGGAREERKMKRRKFTTELHGVARRERRGGRKVINESNYSCGVQLLKSPAKKEF